MIVAQVEVRGGIDLELRASSSGSADLQVGLSHSWPEGCTTLDDLER
jgi:hypothetical protein